MPTGKQEQPEQKMVDLIFKKNILHKRQIKCTKKGRHNPLHQSDQNLDELPVIRFNELSLRQVVMAFDGISWFKSNN